MITEQNELSEEKIRDGLPTQFTGQRVVYFDSIDSTNRLAKELAKDGAPEGTLIIANSQTRGRGRLGRQWLSPPGSSLLMSLILRPPLRPAEAARTTMVCSLAVADAIERMVPIKVRIKWPNDITIDGRKAGGILTELGLRDERLDFVVVGIGLNVNLNFDGASTEFPPDSASDTSQASLKALKSQSTALNLEAGHNISRLSLLREVLVAIEGRYQALRAGSIPNEEWSRRLETLGQPVTVTTSEEIVTGHAEGVDHNGALLVRLANGRLRQILAGDVTLRVAS